MAKVFHYDLFGLRDDKYAFLKNNSIATIPYVQLENKAPNYFMVQKDLGVQGDYEKGFNVSKLMALNAVGIVTARDSFTIHHTKQQVKDTTTKFLNMENEEARKYFELGKDVRDWQVGFAKKDLEDFPNGGLFLGTNQRARSGWIS